MFLMEDNTNPSGFVTDQMNFKSIFSDDNLSNNNHVCQYYEEEACLNKFQSIKGKSFTILSLNIRSLPGKWLDFNQFLASSFGNYKPSVICLQEIWNIPTYADFSLEDYHPLIYNTRDVTGLNGNAGGGVGMFIHNSFNFEPLLELSTFLPRIFESQFVKLKTGKNKYTIIGNIYRPNSAPFADLKIANSQLKDILHSLKSNPLYKKSSDINIVGDFNIDLLKYQIHSDTETYLETLLEYSLLPIVTLPTRISHNSTTIIDHISTSFLDNNYDVGIIISDLSDHFPVFYTRSMHDNILDPPELSTIRRINDNTKEIFNNLLQNYDWTHVLNNFNPASSFDDFFQVIDFCYNQAFPEMVVRPAKRNKPNSPWMTKGILKSRNVKLKLLSKKLRNPTQNNIEKYKAFNSIYTKLIRKARQSYYNSKFKDYSKDCKKTWQTINDLLGRKKCVNDVPKSFVSNGKILSGEVKITEGFNDFFVNIGPKLSKSIPIATKHFSEYMTAPCSENFIFANITPDIVNEALKRMKSKNSSGHDKISSNLLKFIAPSVMLPLCHLFNLSFKLGYIPDCLKIAMVKPIYKKGPQDNFTNYRPISLLSSFSKLLEKIASNQMMKYINKFRLLYEHQYGFRAGYNTTQPLLHFLDNIFNSLNSPNNDYSLAIFIDLTKAFDTCDIDILLYKLNHYGFRGIANQWFKSYLTGRKQFTSIKGVNSSLKELLCGVPQGSILGPLLFILLINDLPNATDFFNILYADDTTLQKSSNDLRNLFNEANIELEKLSDWFKANKLTLNVSKTKYILFRKKSQNINFSDLKLTIDDEQIDRIGHGCREESFKFVGIHLDELLTWDFHAKHVYSKVANAVFALSKLKNILPIKAKIIIYNSLFRSFIEFGICAWGRTKSKQINRIISLQKRAMRCIANATYNAHTDPIFAKLGILKFNDLLDLNQICFVHKFINDKLPLSFRNFFKKLNNFNRNMSFCLPSIKYHQSRLLPSYSMPLLWNDLTLDMKRILSFNTFKKKCTSSLLSKYSTTCTDATCFSCNNVNP